MNDDLRIGGLFEGTGGLTMGVRSVLGGRVVFHSEIDPAPSKILAHHWPEVPNIGDITKVDWRAVIRDLQLAERRGRFIEVLTGGSPCQDVSTAGQRRGMRPGTRSGLWASMREAIAILRPRLVVWENVRGVTSACAHSELADCPRCVGGSGPHRPVLRALGRVLGDLADLGFDAEWHGVRAADIGAPHGRWREFVLAWDANDQPVEALQALWQRALAQSDGAGEPAAADAGCEPRQSGGGEIARGDCEPRASHRPQESAATAANASGSIGRRGRLGQQAGNAAGRRRPNAGGCGAPADPHGARLQGDRALADGEALADAVRVAGTPADAINCAPTESRRGQIGSREADRVSQPDGADPATDSDFESLWQQSVAESGGSRAAIAQHPVSWGRYAPAIERWEHALGRVAPAPTELSAAYLRRRQRRLDRLDPRPVGMRGSLRPVYHLSAAFVEWLMGLPEGHVTDPAIGLTRNEMLKALGNGVVPQQSAAAVLVCLSRAVAA